MKELIDGAGGRWTMDEKCIEIEVQAQLMMPRASDQQRTILKISEVENLSVGIAERSDIHTYNTMAV